MKIRNPRTGDCDFEINITDSDRLSKQVNKSRAAQQKWSNKTLDERISVLQELKNSLIRNGEIIVQALSIDTGRTTISKRELEGLCGSIDRWCEDAIRCIDDSERQSKVIPSIAIKKHRDPYPVLGVISPWNFPLLLSFIDAVPALLAGCAVIIKPSEITPRFVVPLMTAINEVDELENIISFVHGDGSTGANLIQYVDIVAFTGSVSTGKKVAAAAAKAFIPVCLELGGKDPAIVMKDSDIDRATTSILRASIIATGQACQSLERIYVDAVIYDEFTNLLTKKSKKIELSLNDGDGGMIGPLIFEKQAEIISEHIKAAKNKGAKIHCGGEIENHHGGLWIKPTVMSHVKHDMKIMTDETFGPIMPIMSFNSTQEAIDLANDSCYGLSAAVFGKNYDEITEIAKKINCGGISINDAGLTSMIFEEEKNTYKNSGMGPSRNGPEGFTRFFRKKALFLNKGDVFSIEDIFKPNNPRK